MKRSILFFAFAYLILLLIISCSIPQTKSSSGSSTTSTTIPNGTITVTFTGSPLAGRTAYFGVFPNSLTQANLNKANALGSNNAVISTGPSSAVIGILGNEAVPLTLTGGSVYQIAGFIDFNGDASTTGYNPDGGDLSFNKTNITINGNQTITVNCATDLTIVMNVCYSGNGNTGGSAPTDSAVYSIGATITALGNTGNLVKIPTAGTAEAFKFGGWNTQADGNGTTYAAGTGTFTLTGETTLYAKWVPFSLRDAGPAGGLICYDKGSFATDAQGNKWRYLEAAPSDQSTGIAWWNGCYTTTGATGTAVGTGTTNTVAIIKSQEDGSYAATACKTYTNNGYSDWFLPSKDELNSLYTNLYCNVPSVGGFAADFYWSSSETTYVFALIQLFSGSQGTGDKYYPARVRAVREF